MKIQSDPIGTLSDAQRERESSVQNFLSSTGGERERKRGVEEDLTKCYKTNLKKYIKLKFLKKSRSV